MRLVSLHLRDFRVYRRLDLDLQDLLVITGGNDSGKTTVIRAVRWLLLNQAEPLEEIAHHGASSCSVLGVFDTGYRIERFRSKEKNLYRITDPRGVTREIGKVGNQPLEEVMDLVGFRPIDLGRTQINIHFQGVDCDNLLYAAPADLAALFAHLSGSARIERAVRLAASELSDVSSRLKQARATLEQQQGTMGALAFAQSLPTLVEALQEAERVWSASCANVVALRGIQEAVAGVQVLPESTLPHLQQLKDETISSCNQLEEARGRTLALRVVAQLVDGVREVGALPKSASAEAAWAEVLRVREEVSSLRALQSAVSMVYEVGETDLQFAEAEFHQALTEDGACPLCGQSVS